MVEPMLIDLKALLVEREDCDAGTVQKLRSALAQGGTQYRTLRDVTDLMKKKLEASTGAAAENWHLKLGIASFFLGYTTEAVEHLRQAEGSLASFYLGRALACARTTTRPPRRSRRPRSPATRQPGAAAARRHLPPEGRHSPGPRLLAKLEEQGSHNAEYHFQLGSCFLPRANASRPSSTSKGRRTRPRPHRRPVPAGPRQRPGRQRRRGHRLLRALPETSAGPRRHAEEPRRPLRGPRQVRQGRRVLPPRAVPPHPTDEQARLVLKDAQASQTMYYSPEEEHAFSRFSQVLEIPVTDFELSVRSRNCLKKMNIRTLGDLTRVSEQQLLSSKNFGETSLNEIKEMMTTQGPAPGPVAGGGRPERHALPAAAGAERAGAGGAEQAGHAT